jgi:hypothetical protein
VSRRKTPAHKEKQAMKYMLLIYENEAAEAGLSEQERAEVFQAHMRYAQELGESGLMAGGDPLLPTSSATTVRVRNGKTTTTHGPFAETAEQLGGYYLIQCENLDQALEWAAKIPTASSGSIEVRPIWEFS